MKKSHNHNRKLALKKLQITRLNNLSHIKGGVQAIINQTGINTDTFPTRC